MKTFKKIVFDRPHRKLRVEGNRYASRHTVNHNRFVCSDRFTGRVGIPYYQRDSLEAHKAYQEDFMAFSIKELDDRTLNKDFDMKSELPELYNVLTAMKGKVDGHRVYGINKFHTIMLFKLVRQLISIPLTRALVKTSELINEGYGPIRAHIMATIHEVAVRNDDSFVNGSYCIFNRERYWYAYDYLKFNKNNSHTMFFVYPLDLDDLIMNVLPKTQSFQHSFPTIYNSLTHTHYEKVGNHAVRLGFYKPYVNGASKQIQKTLKDAYSLAKKKNFKKLAKLLPEQRYI